MNAGTMPPATSIPSSRSRTVDQVFAEEQPQLLALPVSPFDGYQENTVRVSPQLLISFDRNRYSVNAMAVRQNGDGAGICRPDHHGA